MTLDASASLPHYFDHLRPILKAYGDEAILWTESSLVEGLAQMAGIPVRRGTPLRPSPSPLLVASYHDAARSLGRSLILLEHGAGQTYQGVESPSYAGGPLWERARLILSPGPHSARAWRAAYPEKAIVELGGSPRLDLYAKAKRRRASPAPAEKAVGFAWHWNAYWVCPETAGTWGFWLDAIDGLAKDSGHEVLIHAHPRAQAEMAGLWAPRGIEFVSTFEEMLERCWLLCADNTSVMYEWAALDRPVLCLDHPGYRRDVEHGLRFWGHRPGPCAVAPENLARRVEEAWADPPEAKALRCGAVEEAYGGFFDGKALGRALRALEGVWV